MTTTIAAMKALAAQFQQQINQHNLDGAVALFDPNLVDHTQGPSVTPGTQDLRSQYGMFLGAFPDFRLELEAISAEGDWVVLHGIYQGTHTGAAYLNAPAAGNPFKTYVVEVFRVKDGKFVERHRWFDIMTLLRALQTPGGAEPAMGTRAGAAPSTTTPDQKRARIRQYFNEMVIPRNIDRMPFFLGDNVLDHSAPPGLPSGVEGARMFLNMNYASFPWTDYDIQHVIADGDLVTVVFEIVGEHTGAPFFGVPASGKRFKVQCIEIERVPGEHFLEHWGGMDFVQLSAQLGLGLFGESQDQQQAAVEQDVRRLAEDYIEGMNEGNIDRVMSVFADSFIDHQVVPGGATMGNDFAAVRLAHVMLHESFPDVKFSLRDLIIDGDIVFMMVRGEGTHMGAFFGMPATGKHIKWAGTRVLRYANGKFVDGTSELDQVSILQQMGILPTPPVVYDTAGHKKLVRSLIDEINHGNPHAYSRFMAHDVLTNFESAETPVKGVRALNDDLGVLRSAFHDLHVEIETMAAYQDKVSVRVRYTGTHAGTYMGVAGTGQVYHWSGALTFRIDDGKITEMWTNTDRFTLLQQVGIIPRFG
ncbi:MAG: ester cyclase [Anaerolineae bacterium]|nr:ester cyclase [Anaerolineae bacterium]